jgi:hypothetical protein
VADTKLLQAIFTAVCALAEKLTGEHITAHVDLGDGQIVGLTGGQVSWAPSDFYGPPAEPHSKLATPLASRGAIEREPSASAQP